MTPDARQDAPAVEVTPEPIAPIESALPANLSELDCDGETVEASSNGHIPHDAELVGAGTPAAATPRKRGRGKRT